MIGLSPVSTAAAIHRDDRDAAPLAALRSVSRARALLAAVACAGVVVWMLAAPFETREPLLRLPGQSVSNLEAISLGVIAACIAAALATRTWPRWRTGLTLPWLAWLAAMTLAAAAAPEARGNALHMAGRMGFGFAVFLVTVNGLTTPMRIRQAMTAAVLTGTVVAALTTLEYLQVPAVLRWLLAFRPGVSVLGDQIRAAGPLQYATIASMYLEIVFALGLGLLMYLLDARQGAWAVAAGAALLAIAEAITFTFTRAGLATMAMSLVLVAAIRYRQQGIDRGVRVLAVLSVLIVVLFAASRSTQALRLRFTSAGQEAWYKAEVQAPAEVNIAAGTRQSVPITITNAGRFVWRSDANPPILLSYHWLQADADRVITYDGARTRFEVPVPPQGTVSLSARVDAPRRPGRYRIAWDVVQEGRLWFSTEPGGTLTMSRVTVSGSMPSGLPPLKTTPLPRPVERPGRLTLWGAAARMFSERPLLGVGPDNYRLFYGPYAGVVNPDDRMHSNNMYVEMWVGGGLVGGLAFLWLVWRAAACFAAAATRRGAAGSNLGLGVAAAGLAIGLHGLLDSFFSFTPTNVVFAMTLGLAVAFASAAETVTDAHRI